MGIQSTYHFKMSMTDKCCAVCGDKALGHNFNAITCESCKAFFRRNALSTKQFTCPFNQKCEINVVTRRFCQRCRLEKCFNTGMRKDYIMSEADKILKRRKIELNRVKRKMNGGYDGMAIKFRSDANFSPPIYSEKWDKMECSLNSSYLDVSSPDSRTNNDSPGLRRPVSPLTFDIMNRMHTMSRLAPSELRSPTVDHHSTFRHSSLTSDVQSFPDRNSSATEIVNFIVDNPTQTPIFIDNIMPTPDDAIEVITKIVNSQKDAMALIGYLIGNPLHGLKIIGKIMNSPLNALAVFSKFVNSPNNSLEFIAKVVSSPTEVLQFVRQLMASPENAGYIISKFMDSPAEAWKILNNMVHEAKPVAPDSKSIDGDDPVTGSEPHAAPEGIPIPPIAPFSIGTFAHIPMPTLQSFQNYFNSMTHHDMHSIDLTPPQPFSTSSASMSRLQACSSPNIVPKNHSPGLSEEFPSLYSYHDASTTNSDESKQYSNDLEAVIAEAIDVEYNVMGMKHEEKSRDLNDLESAKLNELIVANKALYMPVEEDLTSLAASDADNTKERKTDDPQLLTLINLTAIAIKRLIKMAKKINSFKNMCQTDQVILLKGGCTEMMILRSVMQYDIDHSTWQIPQNRDGVAAIRTDLLKLANNNVYEEYESFIRTFDGRLRKDENVIFIMSAIVLFSPNRPMTIHSDVLKLEQNSYYYLLRRYLESIYTGCEAKSLYLKMIQKINELKHLKKVIIDVYLDANPSQVEPLLREIFDLQNH